jgi:D-alanine-D-alanine ligase
MRIGLTYDLRRDWSLAGQEPADLYAEFDSEETIAALRTTLEALGHEAAPIGAAASVLPFFARERVDLVFNIAEGLGGRSREAQVPCLLELLGVPYVFSGPLTLACTLDKAMAKRLVLAEGLPTARFAEVSSVRELFGKALGLRPPLFLKPVHEGSAKGVGAGSVVTEPASLQERVAALLEAYGQPVLVEEYLPGEEFTVAVLGTGEAARALGTMQVTVKGDERNVYGYDAKERCEELVDYLPGEQIEPELRSRVELLALAAYRALGCLDGGRLDIRCDGSGEPQFLEVNPLPGLHPTHSDLPIIARQQGTDYPELIGEILASACRRWGLH